jgi:hypothetical protein
VARRGLIWSALVPLLAACQEAPPAVEMPPAASEQPILPPAAGPAARVAAELCPALTRVVAAEDQGFAGLRARRLAAETWLAAAPLPGAERCTIEGESWPRARYQCVGRPIARGPAGAAAAFEALAGELAACLDSPIWFPREWQAGARFEFAMGERLQAWTDRSTTPPSQVVLNVEQDAATDVYRLTLDLETAP